MHCPTKKVHIFIQYFIEIREFFILLFFLFFLHTKARKFAFFLRSNAETKQTAEILENPKKHVSREERSSQLDDDLSPDSVQEDDISINALPARKVSKKFFYANKALARH